MTAQAVPRAGWPGLPQLILQALQPSRKQAGLRALRDSFPVHTDGTLLTLAPRGSCPGLAVKDYSSGEWLPIEATMADDEAVLFCWKPLLSSWPSAVKLARTTGALGAGTPGGMGVMWVGVGGGW